MFGPSITSAYAILALAHLAGRSTEWIKARTLAEALGIPQPYLVKILARFRERRLVATKRGYLGGYRLETSPEEINLLDIITTVDGPGFLRRCLLGAGKCSPERPCPLHPVWSKERARIRHWLAEATLRDVAASNPRTARETTKEGK